MDNHLLGNLFCLVYLKRPFSLLFIIYINSAPGVTDSSITFPLHADDMKCYRIITDYSVEKKCKHLAITKRRNILQTSYNLNGSRITDVMFNWERSYGFHISSTLRNKCGFPVATENRLTICWSIAVFAEITRRAIHTCFKWIVKVEGRFHLLHINPGISLPSACSLVAYRVAWKFCGF